MWDSYSNSAVIGEGVVKGDCGETMKFVIEFRDGVVSDCDYWTDGCRFSSICAQMAACLSIGKTPAEVESISAEHIREALFVEVPDDHEHCLVLAEATLKKALDDYERSSGLMA